MTVEQFKDSIIIIDKENANLLREIYIETFINTNKDYYKNLIETTKTYMDGECYEGYLWDCFLKPKRISNFALTDMLLKNKGIYVMWDIHSCENINIEFYKELLAVSRYWLFDKDAVLQMSPKALIEGLKYLPEDIYIYNNTFEWSLCYTHEFDKKNRHWLIYAEPKSVTC